MQRQSEGCSMSNQRIVFFVGIVGIDCIERMAERS